MKVSELKLPCSTLLIPFHNSITAFFYVFDSLPLLVGICTYAVYWPSRYLQPSDNMSANIPLEAAIDA